jgi:hypothetical protein
VRYAWEIVRIEHVDGIGQGLAVARHR